MKLAITQHAFTTGQVSNSVIRRRDVKQLESAVKLATNCFPIKQGPLLHRTGTEFISEVKYSDKITRIKEFVFSVEQALILEIGDYYIRFYVSGAQIVKAYSAWATTTDYKVGDLVTESGNYYRCLETHTSGTFATDLGNDLWVLSGGADDVAYEIVTPYAHTQVNKLSIAGTADVIYICDGALPPTKISRYANDDWVLETVVFEDGPFNTLNTDYSKKVSLDAYTLGSRTLTCTGDIFSATDVGKLFRIQKRPTTAGGDGAIALMRITAYTDAQHVTVNLPADVDADFLNEKEDWRFGAFGGQYVSTSYDIDATGAGEAAVNTNYTFNGYYFEATNGSIIIKDLYKGRWAIYISGGLTEQYINTDISGSLPPTTGWAKYIGDNPAPTLTINETELNTGSEGEFPAKVGINQERLIYGNTPSHPQTLWFSQTAGYESHSPTNEYNEVLDDSAFAYSLSGGNTIDAIQWISSSPQLAIGTTGGEFILRLSTQDPVITPTNVSFIRQSNRGSVSNQQVQNIGGMIIYVQRLGKIIRGMEYDVATDRFVSIDLTKLSDDILGGGAVDSAYQPEPTSTLFYVRSDGKLIPFTFDKEDSVNAWSTFDVNGTVSSVAIIPDGETKYDTYVLVTRTIDGNTVKYIERFTAISDDANYWNYLDCSLEYHDEATAISTATGLDHLEGETVTIFADGEVRSTTAVVSSGQVSLGASYNHVVIGLAYSTVIQLCNVEASFDNGSTVGKNKRVVKLTLELLEESLVKCGKSLSALYEVSSNEDNPTIYEHEPDDDMSITNGDLYIVHDTPTPFALATITREVEFRD